MEFSCRLVTARGEITEGVYTADTEARLRHELEDKGLHILSLQARGGIGGFSISLPRRRKISAREFLEFNQELATLLKAGMPLVQSLDLLRGGISNPLFRSVLDAVRPGVVGQDGPRHVQRVGPRLGHRWLSSVVVSQPSRLGAAAELIGRRRAR